MKKKATISTGVREQSSYGSRLPTSAIRKQNEMDKMNSYRGEGGTFNNLKRPDSQIGRRSQTKINSGSKGFGGNTNNAVRKSPKKPYTPSK